MTHFMQSNLSLLAGAILLVALLALRAAARDPLLRGDLRASAHFLGIFLVLRLASLWLGGHLGAAERALNVAWMLTFAFGGVRALVGLSLWALRLRDRVPKILRDVIDFTLYATAAIPIIKSQLDVDLTGLLATSAILSVVLGLALQETLGNLFAGLSLQLERPFKVGDWVTVGEHTGMVAQLAWRSTRIETLRREVVTLPNAVVAKQAVLNFSHSPGAVALEITFEASYSAPPNQVRAAVLGVLAETPRLLVEPKPFCRVTGYGQCGLIYEIRYFVAEYVHGEVVRDEIYSRLWYRFAREGLELPFAQMTVHLPPPAAQEDNLALRRGLVAQADLFAPLSEAERENIAQELAPRRFGRGEQVIAEGAEGNTFYLVASGAVSVRTARGEAEVAKLRRGEYFGEMSLLTGEGRSATVVATEDAVLLELDRPSFGRIFEKHPGLARQLSSLLAERRSQLKAVAAASGPVPDSSPEAGRIFARLRQIFGLRGD